MSVESEFNNLVRQYNRRGIKDSALTKTFERLDDLYHREYGEKRNAPRSKPVKMSGSEGFNDALEEIMQDFIDDKSKKIGMFDMRKKENVKRIETFKKNHPNMEFSPQAYIDYIEGIEDFRQSVADLASLPSKQVKDIMAVGKANNLTDEQIQEIANGVAENMAGVGRNTNDLAEMIRTVASIVTPSIMKEGLNYEALVTDITNGKYKL